MGMFTSRHKQTKKSYLANAIVAFVLGIFMIACIFIQDEVTSEEIKGFVVSAGIVWLMGLYWVKKHINFEEDKKKKHIMDDLMF